MAFRLRTALLLTLLIALLAGAPTGGHARSTSPGDAVPAHPYRAGELLIKFAPITPLSGGQDSARSALQNYAAERIETLGNLRTELWRVPEGRELELATLLSMLPGVEYAEPNYEVRAHLVPDDTYYSQQWAHPMINSPAAWNLTTGDAGVTIAILDTGVDLHHPEFQGRLVPGYSDFGNGSPDDDQGHGTHVAGIVAAAGNNGIGVAGMAWQARIMPIKVLDADGRGSHAGIARGMDWAVDHGARIINLSLGGTASSTTLQTTIERARSRGVLIIASAGNCGDTNHAANGCDRQNQPIYPAAYDQVLAVAATTSGDSRAGYSNSGSYVDVAAPGSSILSTASAGAYRSASGTSQAAPFVSGLAALIWSLDSTLTATEVEMIIKSTAVDKGLPGFDPDFGYGRIDAWAAVANTHFQAPILYEVFNPDRDMQYTVDWSDVPFASSYTLEEADNPTFSTPRTIYTGASSHATLTEQHTGTWYYRVRATRSGSGTVSTWSNAVSVSVGLDMPVLLRIDNAGQMEYQVRWEAVGGATGYRLQEAASPDFSGASTRTTASTFYSITAAPGSTLYYRVQAFAGSGAVSGPWSNVQSAHVLPAAPASITLTPVDADAYTINWSPVAGANGYRLLETAVASGISVTRYVGKGTTYQVTGQPSGRWIYTVRAFNAAGDGPPIAADEMTVTMPIVPIPEMAPINNANKDNVYTVQWTDSPTATQYTLEESRTPWFEAPTVVYTGTSTQYVALDQPAGRWHYRVRTHFGIVRSPWSDSVDVSVSAEVYLPLITR